ncbi:MAG: helix-turn-helix domain-containing protein [Desulfobulbaceae bacterium]|nr:helix-turn-helix domain-containing protein [Desulfobulbaceae bacterium]
MNQPNSKPEKKKRRRRSAEKMAELVLEAERIGASKVCRREGIAPAQLSRWKQKFLMGGIASLKEIKRGPKAQEDPATTELKTETERLSQALVETSIELQAIKKRNRSG